MLNTFSRSLIIWEPAIEAWAQEMHGGAGNELEGPESWTASPPWKLYVHPCLQLKTNCRRTDQKQLATSNVFVVLMNSLVVCFRC